MLKLTKNYRLLLALALGLIVIVAAVVYFSPRSTVPPGSREEEWRDFKSYVASMQLPDKKPLYSGTGTMGCFRDEARDTPLPDCTFSGSYLYTLMGNYRDDGKQIYAFLQQHGFYFADKYSQRKFEDKLNNKTITDNLSSSESIIVDLKNKNGTWVRFSLGDKGRLMTPGSTDIEPALSGVTDQQLIARLEFFKTY